MANLARLGKFGACWQIWRVYLRIRLLLEANWESIEQAPVITRATSSFPVDLSKRETSEVRRHDFKPTNSARLSCSRAKLRDQLEANMSSVSQLRLVPVPAV